MSDESFEVPDFVPDELTLEQLLKHGADKLAAKVGSWREFWGKEGLGAAFSPEDSEFVVVPRDLLKETLESERSLAEMYVALITQDNPNPAEDVLDVLAQFNGLILVNKVIAYIASVAPGVPKSE